MSDEKPDEMPPMIILFARGVRERLPKRRKHGPQEILIQRNEGGELKVYVAFGHWDDNRHGEIWLNVAKTGSELNTIYGVWAMTASKALQYGMPLEELAGTLRHVKDAHAGTMFLDELDEDPGRPCSSLWDAIGQFLGMEARGQTWRDCPPPIIETNEDDSIQS